MSSKVFTVIGASNHAKEERALDDFYATEPKAIELLLEKQVFPVQILEPACGKGHISKVLKEHGFEVASFDIVDRGYGQVKDFFSIDKWGGDIITNPPYKDALKWVEHALEIIPEGYRVAMFLRTLFLEGKARGRFFKENPPQKVLVASGRLNCAKNGDFETYTTKAQSYSWFIWTKGFKGKPTIDWINL